MKRRRVDGDEQDMFSRWGRRYLHWRPGVRAKIRKKLHKRERREGRVEARQMVQE